MPAFAAGLPGVLVTQAARDGVPRALVAPGIDAPPLGGIAWAWLAGAIATLACVIVAQHRMAGRLKRAVPVRSRRMRRMLRRLRHRRRVTTAVRLSWRIGPGVAPCVTGLGRPTILLPRAARAWPASRLAAVLVHELEHVRRRDVHGWLLAELACCVLWFHPLAWRCAARYRIESDMACDDAVLDAGATPSRYADDLVRLVRGSRREMAAVAFAGRRWLSERVTAVLDPSRPRRPTPATLRAALALLSIVASLAIAVMTPAWTRRLPPAERRSTPRIVVRDVAVADGAGTRVVVTLAPGSGAAGPRRGETRTRKMVVVRPLDGAPRARATPAPER
jgi:beta-lactamase regulating signal transducer with metallopeptidase domain